MSELMPSYVHLLNTGEMAARAAAAVARLERCDLCPWNCRVNRLASAAGVCRTGARARVCSFGPHMGEEAPLTGWRGSGTIFFGRCNLACQYCQNWEISQTDAGDEVEPAEIAAIMLKLQQLGCHNINLVSPSHVVAPIIQAVHIAARSGLRLPLVYNTGGFDAPGALGLLRGIVDIYMPDMKYSDARTAHRYSRAANYPAVNRAAVREMHRQVGDLRIDGRGIAIRGLLVRHLVLPGGLAGTGDVVRFLAGEISRNTYLNLMNQYRPSYRAARHPELSRPITQAEYDDAVQLARSAGLRLPGG